MTNNESEPGSHKARLSSRLTFFGAFLITLVLACALGIWLVNRFVVFDTEGGNGMQAALVRTPLGRLPQPHSQGWPFTLWAVVYPNSKWDEQDHFVFYDGRAGAEKKSTQLAVARFTTTDSLQQVDDWYREQLGGSFTRTTGWSMKENDQPEWTKEVRSNSDSDTRVYRREANGRVQGIVLDANATGASVVLFDFRTGER